MEEIISVKKKSLFTALSACMVLMVFNISTAKGQEIVWASKVIKFSSETGTINYSSKKILGKPDAKADSLGNTWRPNSQGKAETIEIGFPNLVKAKQILIVESVNPGYIKSVVVKNADGIEFPIASFNSKPSVKGPRLLSINAEEYGIEIASVIITVFPIRNVPVTIDAVGVTESNKHFKLTDYINVEEIQN